MLPRSLNSSQQSSQASSVQSPFRAALQPGSNQTFAYVTENFIDHHPLFCHPHYNAHSIGICYEGGLDENGVDKDTRTPEQRAALIALLRSLKEDYPDAEIMGHCELEGVHKACPCFSCQEYRNYFERKDKLV